MTTTLELCNIVADALQVPGVEKHAARLVRAGYLPRSDDEDDAASTPAARRQRRHRARRKQGRFVVPVEVTGEMILRSLTRATWTRPIPATLIVSARPSRRRHVGAWI